MSAPTDSTHVIGDGGGATGDRFDDVVRLPKVEIYVTDVCNNRCSYCSTGWENTEQKRSTLKHVPRETIRKHLEDSWERGARRVLLQGGEPTVRRDLGDLIADAREVGFQVITVFTNARAAASPIGARWIASLGVTWFQVSIQGGNAEMHDASVVAGRAFDQTVAGTRRLLALGQRVKVNGVLTRHLLDSIGEFARLMIDLRPEEVGLDVVRPSPAFAPGRESYEDLLPPLSRYSIALRDALLSMNDAGVTARIISCPPCLVPGAEHLVSDEPNATMTQLPSGDFMHKITQRRSLQVKAEHCTGCAYFDTCPGLFGAYVEHHGLAELRPIAERRPIPSRSRPAPGAPETALTRALRDALATTLDGRPLARATRVRPDGTHEVVCESRGGDVTVLVAPRSDAPAFARTARFSVSYRANRGEPAPDITIVEAVVARLRAAEPTLPD